MSRTLIETPEAFHGQATVSQRIDIGDKSQGWRSVEHDPPGSGCTLVLDVDVTDGRTVWQTKTSRLVEDVVPLYWRIARPDLRGLAARHVEPDRSPDRAVDWQRKATELSELLAAAQDEIDRLRASNKSLHLDLGLMALSRDHERTLRLSCEAALERDQAALEAATKQRVSRDCRTCVHESRGGDRQCNISGKSPFFWPAVAWIGKVGDAGLLDSDLAIIADTPTDCPGWAGKEKQ